MVDVTSQRCSSCRLELPPEAFAESAAGRVYRCRSCDTERKGVGEATLVRDITGGGEAMAAFGSPMERACAEQLIATGSLQGAADLIGLETRVLRAHLYELRRKAASRGYAPGNDMTKATPDGYHVKGVSTYYDAEGKVKGQWVKTKADEEHHITALLDAMSHLADQWQGAFAPVDAPLHVEDDLMCVYPMGDPHIGMYAWAEETGQSFDMRIAEQNLCAAVDQLVAGAPQAKRALLLNLGDYFHGDNSMNRTMRSGHALDIDTRWPKVLRVGLRAFRRNIDRALEKHEVVDVWCMTGNHDDHSAIMLALALEQAYEREPRVRINTSPAKFQFTTHGRVMIASTHTDTCKMADLAPIMAADRPVEWGATEHRYGYTGHVHHKSVIEVPGAVIESFRTLAPKDAYHAASKYRSGQDMTMIVLHKLHGEVSRNTVGISRLKEIK